MAVTLSTGAQFAISSAYGTQFTVSAITNANPAVATLSASHGVAVGDYIELTSGWDLLTGKVVRVSAVTTNDVTLEGIDTSDTTKYPAAGGAGTGREITSWANITQVQAVSPGGGEQNYADITSVADRTQKQAPTTRNATTVDLTVFDDPSLGYYATVSSASDSAAIRCLRVIFPNSSRLLLNGYWSLQKMPQIANNAPLTAQISISGLADPVRYAT